MTKTELLSLVAAQLLSGQAQVGREAIQAAVMSANRIVTEASALSGEWSRGNG